MYNTFWRRVGSAFIDLCIMGVAAWLTALLANLFFGSSSGSSVGGLVVGNILGFSYNIIMCSRYGQTLGKMATGVKIMDVGERRIPSLKQAFLRDSVLLLFSICNLGHIIWHAAQGVVLDEDQPTTFATALMWASSTWLVAELTVLALNYRSRAIHDYIAGTVVIKVSR